MSSIKSCPRFCVNIIFRSRALKSSFQCSLQRAIVQSWDLPWSALSCIESKFVGIFGQKYQKRRKTWPKIKKCQKNEKKIVLKYIMERRGSCSHHNEPRRSSLRQKLCNRGNLWNQRNAGCRDFRSWWFLCPRESLNFYDVDVLSTLGVWWMGSHKGSRGRDWKKKNDRICIFTAWQRKLHIVWKEFFFGL